MLTGINVNNVDMFRTSFIVLILDDIIFNTHLYSVFEMKLLLLGEDN